MVDYPNKLNIIFDKLLINNIKPIIIGGYVRDFLLKIESKDIDVELYGINSFSKLENILEEFGDVNSVGKSFGVCKLRVDDLDIDFSFPRSDSKIDKGHKGFEIKVDSSLDFKTATSRRDFTINAIGYDIKTNKILDPFNGREDLKNKILKAVDIVKFQEDPLRVLRAVQFCSRFNLSIDNELFVVCKKMIKESILDELPKERIFIEIKKLLLKSTTPSLGLKLLNSLDGFNYFTEFKNIDVQNLENIYKTVDTMSSLKTQDSRTNTILMLAALCYQLALSECETFLSKLSNDKNLFAKVLSLLKHQNDINFNLFSDYDIYILATKVTIEEFVLFSLAKSQTKIESKNINNLKTRAKELGVFHQEAKAVVQGKDIISLGIKPSKEFSIILDRAYRAQISGNFKTKKEAYAWLKRELFT
ncbi:MAG: CCA tRNA nucleotidyltransferase [Sulfurimonas sp.]|nr:CCA tRNA nucleotidyltransferase [Sulfurimonas sp.]